MEEVEAVYRRQEPMNRDATLKRWRYLATREVVKWKPCQAGRLTPAI